MKREAVSGWRLAVSSDAASALFDGLRSVGLQLANTELDSCPDAGRGRSDYPLTANR